MILAQLSRGCRELPLFDSLWRFGPPPQHTALWYPCDSSLPQVQLCTTPKSSSGYPGDASSAPQTAPRRAGVCPSAPAPSSRPPAGPSAASPIPPTSPTSTTGVTWVSPAATRSHAASTPPATAASP